MASSLTKAINVAPEFANYYEKRGFALSKLAELAMPTLGKRPRSP